jgi:ribose transport system ATP-binding protein
VRWRKQAEHTRALLSRVTPEQIDLFQPMAKAPRLHVTAVAVARVLEGVEDRNGMLMIFDEPTSALPTEEIERLMRILRDLRDAGNSILVVSHALDEVMEIAERVTVLRDGQRIDTVDVAGITEHDLVTLMLGNRELPTQSAPAAADHTSAVSGDRPLALGARGLCGVEVDDLDLEVGVGEVLGVTGLLGSGHLELAYLLAGATAAEAGQISVGDRTMPAKLMTPSLAKKLGMGFVPADRVKEGLIGPSTIAENISLPRLRSFQKGGLLRHARVARDAKERVERAGVRPANPQARVEVLSGGNKQKVVLAKALANTRHALIIAEPTIGVDIGAKMGFYDQIRAHAREGIGILVCSTDLTDLTAVCDRVIALRSGRIEAELTGDEINEHRMLAAITGFGAQRVAS